MKTKLITLLALTVAQQLNAQSADPLLNKQWALKNQGQVIMKNVTELERIPVKGLPGMDIEWVDTSERETSKKELIVAVLDSGIDLEHPDLKGRIWTSDKTCAGSIAAPGKNCTGYNYLDNNTLLTDDIGHGTHVAGIIAANRNNIGIAGAADPRVKIMPLKVLSGDVSGFVYNGKVITDVIADALNFAVKNGAEVINLSLGWPKLVDLPKVRKAFEDAEAKNVIIIAASGNNNKDLPTFPCSYENVICVGAIDNRGELTDFTNHGSKVDIVAPGESIISTYPQKLESRVLRIKNYELKRGSSQASPYVAAAVANLKLLHPGLTNDQVRNLLFRSSKPIHKDQELFRQERFAKFGMLDMKALLELADKQANQQDDQAFVIPQVKALTEVKFQMKDMRFSFPFTLKNLSSQEYSGLVCLRAMSDAVALDEHCLNVNQLKAFGTQTLSVNGSLLDFRADSHIMFEIQVDEKLYQTSLVFSRDLNADQSLIDIPVTGGNFADMGVISGDRRLSRMGRVSDRHRRLAFPEYFFLSAAKQTAEATVVSVLTKNEIDYQVKTVSLPKVKQVLSIHRQDINLDGKLDYFFYTLSKKEDELQYYLFDADLNPLFGERSTWIMKLTTFEGLPIEGAQEKFEWIKIKSADFGEIVVPSLYRAYAMPEADNSKIIGQRILNAVPHQFYLNPIVKEGKVSIETRVVDSVKAMIALQKKLGIAGSFDAKSVYLLNPLPQTEVESSRGIIRSLVLLEDEGERTFFEATLKLDGDNISSLKKLKAEKAIDQSRQFPIYDLKSGEVTDESIFTALLNRNTTEFIVKSGENADSLILMNDVWENLIIDLLATFNDNGSKLFLVQRRYTLSLLKENGEVSSLPIYRDSSFPGQSFSETLIPIMADGRPGVYVNSTLIYGERIYSMIASDSGLIRPLALSVAIPFGCVPLSPETFLKKQDFQYLFLCVDPQKKVSLKVLPLEAF